MIKIDISSIKFWSKLSSHSWLFSMQSMRWHNKVFKKSQDTAISLMVHLLGASAVHLSVWQPFFCRPPGL